MNVVQEYIVWHYQETKNNKHINKLKTIKSLKKILNALFASFINNLLNYFLKLNVTDKHKDKHKLVKKCLA